MTYNPLTFDSGLDRGYGKASAQTRGFSFGSHWPYQPEDKTDEEEIQRDLDFFLGKDEEDVVNTLIAKLYGPIGGDEKMVDRASGHSAELTGMREEEIRNLVRESLIKISDRLSDQPISKNSFGDIVPQAQAHDSHIKAKNDKESEEEEEKKEPIFRIKTLFKKFRALDGL